MAAKNDHNEIVDHLIKAESDVNRRDLHCQQTPLMSACSMASEKCVRVLLQVGAKINMINTSLLNALGDLFKFIKESWKNQDTPKIRIITLLLLAAGETATVSNLLDLPETTSHCHLLLHDCTNVAV